MTSAQDGPLSPGPRALMAANNASSCDKLHNVFKFFKIQNSKFQNFQQIVWIKTVWDSFTILATLTLKLFQNEKLKNEKILFSIYYKQVIVLRCHLLILHKSLLLNFLLKLLELSFNRSCRQLQT